MHPEPSSLPGQVLGFRDGKVKKTVPALKGFVGMGATTVQFSAKPLAPL